MNEWTSWAIVVRWPHTKEEILAIPGVLDGDDIPLFTGTLGEFSDRFDHPFEVVKVGRYIRVGVDL
jgi:hypothetical protein